MSTGHRLSSIGGAAVAICFFLPWAVISCGSQPVASVSGLDLAAGQMTLFPEHGGGMQDLEGGGDPRLYLVPIAGLGAIALAVGALRRGGLTAVDRFGPVLCGALPLVLLVLKFVNAQSEAADAGFTISYQFGVWGVVLGSLAMIVGGVLNAQTRPASSQERLPAGSTGSPGSRSTGPLEPSWGLPPLGEEPGPVAGAGSAETQPDGQADLTGPPWGLSPFKTEPEPASGSAMDPTCPACGQVIRNEDRFCYRCGHLLQDTRF